MTDDKHRRAMSAQALRLGQLQTFDVHVARLIAIFEDVAASKSRSSPHSQKAKLPLGLQRLERSQNARKVGWAPPTEICTEVSTESQEGSSMQAVLLAGGKGTRLRPYTHVLPKPLMPLGEADPMPIIEVVLRQLGRFGFDQVTIITGYLTELIEAFCGDGSNSVRGCRIAERQRRWGPPAA